MKLRRFLSIAIATTLTASLMLSTLTGCKSNIKANGIYDEDITVGEWIGLVNQQFWYSNSDIIPGNDAEDELQFAMEHDIVPEDGRNWDLDALLTREIAAVTLAGAVTYGDTNQMYIEDLEDSEYQTEILTVVNHGIMGLNSDSCFLPKESVKYVEGSLYLQSAYSFWANYTFEDAVYDVVLQDNVLDFSGISNVSVNEDKDLEVDEQAVAEKKQLLDDNHVQFDDDTYVLKMDSAEALGITEGSVLVIPDGYGNDGDRAVKVTSLEQQADGTYVAQTETPMLDEIVEDLKFRESTEIDLTDLTKCQFYDADGNPILIEEDSSAEESGSVEPVGLFDSIPMLTTLAAQNQTSVLQLDNKWEEMQNGIDSITKTPKLKINTKDGSNTISFEIDGCKIVATMKESDLTLKVEYGESDGPKSDINKTKTATHTFKSSTKDKERTATVSNKGETKAEVAIYDELKVSNLNVNTDVDVWNQYFRATVDYDMSNEFGLSGNIEQTWKLFKLKWTFVPGVALNLTFNLKISVDGSMSICIETDGCSKGFEYSNGQFRSIDEGTTHTQYDVQVKVELTFPIKISLSLVDDKVCEIYGQFEGGAGAKVEVKNNQIEYPDKAPYEVVCIDAKIYPIAKLTIGIKVLADSVLEVDLSHTFVFLSENKGPSWNLHVEDGVRVEKCSVEKAKEAKIAAEQEAEAAASGVEIGDGFCLSHSTIKLIVGESAEIRLNEIPSGYSLLDDVYACYANVENRGTEGSVISVTNIKSMYQDQLFGDMAYSIANTFSSIFNGEEVEMNYLYFDNDDSSTITFTANNPGTVDLYYKTKDGQYSISCRITVITEEEAANSSFQLASSYISVAPGSSEKLEVLQLPGTLTESDLIWTSEDPSIATVDASGNVTGVANGVTTITVTTADGAHTFKCTVSVFADAEENAAYVDDESRIAV